MISLADRDTLRTLRTEIEQALESVAKNHNIKFSIGRIVYDGSGNFCHAKLEVARVSDGGVVVTKEAQDFKVWAKVYDLDTSDLGRKFEQGGSVFELIGLNPRARRMPILAKQLSTGKTFKFSNMGLKARLVD